MRLGCAAGTRSIAITAACLLLFDGCARRTPPEEWGEAVNGLQCSLSCSRRTVSARRPGTLVLKVRNVGQTPARYSVERCCGPTFKVRATFEDGTSLHFADVEQQEHPCGVTDWIALRPGAVGSSCGAILFSSVMSWPAGSSGAGNWICFSNSARPPPTSSASKSDSRRLRSASCRPTDDLDV